MTQKERDILGQLVSDVHQYHSEILTHVGKCEHYFGITDQLNLDINGNPEDREGSPGLMAHVADLRKGRRTLLIVAGGAWTIATMLIGTLVSHWL